MDPLGLMFFAGMIAATLAFGFFVFVYPHVQGAVIGPRPIELQISMSGFLCRVSSGGTGDDDTILLCDAHELLLRIPKLFGRKEYRIPLGDIVHLRVVGVGLEQRLEVQTTESVVEVPAGGHAAETVQVLADRILEVAARAESLSAPRELLDLVDR